MRNQKGQGLIEYTLLLVLVALVFWVGIRNTEIGSKIAEHWNEIKVCVEKPMDCAQEEPA
jgi:Flp pilus assembly pilin Flp